MGGIHQATQSFIILLGFALFKSHHHAKVPKKQDWPNSKLGLDCSSNRRANPSSHQCDFHILDLLCWPSVVLCRWRGSCPDLSRKQLRGLSVRFLIQCLKHPNANWSFYPRTWTPQGSQKCSEHVLSTQFSLFPTLRSYCSGWNVKHNNQVFAQAESLMGTRVTIALKASFTAKAWGWKQERAMFRELKTL